MQSITVLTLSYDHAININLKNCYTLNLIIVCSQIKGIQNQNKTN